LTHQRRCSSSCLLWRYIGVMSFTFSFYRGFLFWLWVVRKLLWCRAATMTAF